MSFIREKKQELTGYQEIEPWNPAIDVNVDFVMAYGNDPSLVERIREFKNRGYIVHLMTGIAWGDYKDYLYGKWDGQDHWSEAQRRENGEIVGHGVDTPYMVPSVAFADYISESLFKAIDAGVVAIHLEEPEFWDFSGYSEAFKKEYELYYRKPWQSPQENLEVHYQAAELKAYLYARTIRRVADRVKEYSQRKYGQAVRVYIPTHSLINYTQWKIMSPEGKLNEIPSLDGFIAQVWTGTSRTPNMYRGKLAERTFETAYCEYSVMQELIKGTNKQMWFLADPIEDNPQYDWSDYQKNYFETVIASLLHPRVHQYEICPWPNRVFNGLYPRPTEKGPAADNSKPIPETYRTQLNNMFQTLGNMEQPQYHYLHNNDLRLGVALSDTALYQRSYPDRDTFGTPLSTEALDFYSSDAFPMFYGMALPLVKNGLPIRCIQIDNVLRVANYLADLDYLVLSYDFMKPSAPAVNSEIAAWVQNGGTLLYVGNESDPYNQIPAWWNDGGRSQQTPWSHLQQLLGIDGNQHQQTPVGKGSVSVLKETPAAICESSTLEEAYRTWLAAVIAANGQEWQQTNTLSLQRGPYLVIGVMKETNEEDHRFNGRFVDLSTPEFQYVTEVLVKPGETRLFYDLDCGVDEGVTIVGTTGRVLSMTTEGTQTQLTVKTGQQVISYLALNHVVRGTRVVIKDDAGQVLPCQVINPEETVLQVIQYVGTGGEVSVQLN